MVDPSASLPPFEPELLVATCSPVGEVLFCNDAWEALFGVTKDPWSLLSDEDAELAARSVQEAGDGSLVTNQIVGVPTPDRESPLPLLLNFLPVYLPEGSREPQVQAVTVSGEVLAEPTSWTISQTQRHRLETLGRMTMGIAHDFNNLLSAILGYTELLKDLKVGTPIPPAYPSHLSTIERAALDGAALVRKIQQYIRREKETRFEPIDLTGVIQDCVSLTRPYWYNEPRRQGIEINLELHLNEVPPILGLASDLREVLVNLILNAIQAMPEGGELLLRTTFDENAGVHIEVQDTGLGMSEAVQQRIFEPLFTTKGEHGTGMGLAVSYGIVQEHDGHIRVRSQLGRGSTFTLTFPPAQEAVHEAPEDAADATPSRSARVLIVDDEPMVRTVLSKLLTLRGHEVETVPSGPVALERMQDTPFDVVIVDQAMPEMSGRQLAQHLRTRSPDLPIVLLTGDTEVGKPDATIDVILNKPFQIDEVEETILRLL